jgi:hypothetical protein
LPTLDGKFLIRFGHPVCFVIFAGAGILNAGSRHLKLSAGGSREPGNTRTMAENENASQSFLSLTLFFIISWPARTIHVRRFIFTCIFKFFQRSLFHTVMPKTRFAPTDIAVLPMEELTDSWDDFDQEDEEEDKDDIDDLEEFDLDDEDLDKLDFEEIDVEDDEDFNFDEDDEEE